MRRQWHRSAARIGAVGFVGALAGALGCMRPLPGPALCHAESGAPDGEPHAGRPAATVTRASACGSGAACVLGRCRRDKTVPVSSFASRSVLLPRALAVISSAQVQGAWEPRMTVVLGRRGDTTTVLVDFAVTKETIRSPVQRAFIVIDPDLECRVTRGELSTELSLVREPWSTRTVSWRHRPAASPPMFAGRWSLPPSQTLRLDVTELLRDALEEPRRVEGLALAFTGTSEDGACFSLTPGALRLELFGVVPPRKKAEKSLSRASGGAL
ncbi:MAG: hypothetical protein EXR75_10130 [Myxococcales bacterium]|nr:hypothetical protein [Myxococcales bacterium]